MKSSFKYIVPGIIACLCIVFLIQLFWLNGLYGTIEEETRKRVNECIRIADQTEMQMRIDSMANLPGQDHNIHISISDTSSGEDQKESDIQKTTRDKDGKTIISSQKNRKIDIGEMDEMIVELKVALHQILDSITPVNIWRLDSLISVQLKAYHIHSGLYGVMNIYLDNDSIIRSSVKQPVKGNAGIFVYEYAPEKHLGYRVYTEPLTRSVLLQMSGILTTTVIIIIILGFAFWYLIRTVIRQKTLEEMKDDFTNNMTHELKTPIAVAYSAADTLLNFKQGEDKSKRDRYLTICKEQLSELNRLVEQILSMSMERRRTFILNRENIRISDLVNNLVTQHQLKSGKDITFHIKTDPQDMMVYADPAHLGNMLSNLMDNAIKYSDKTEVVIDVHITVTDDYYILEVKDNGPGIPPEKQGYVFEKFYRITDGNKYDVKGYGLGLFYVKTMAVKHGGSVSLNSSMGNGSVFTIKIPVK